MANHAKTENGALRLDMSGSKKIPVFVCTGLTALLNKFRSDGRISITGISQVKMSIVKKMLFFGRHRLTGKLWRSIIATVKTHGYNSLTAYNPDIPAELRGGDVRTATMCAAHLCRSIRSFCALSTEGGT